VIYCTGYKISFPFLDEVAIGANGKQFPLYRRIVPPQLPGLYFIGLIQPIGAVMPFAEIQSEWVAELLQGTATLPPVQQMNREIARYSAATVRRYGASTRHAIQVDFLAYMRGITRERQMGVRRTRRARPEPSQPQPRWRADRPAIDAMHG
jgi:Flavin-binding monooxygenase-like